jgi:Fe-S oxidoreductase
MLAGAREVLPEYLLSLSDADKAQSVLIVQDTVTSLYDGATLVEIIQFLTKLGRKVWLTYPFENGKAKHVKGFLPEFVQAASKADSLLRQYDRAGVTMVGVDPAVTLTYREEYRSYVNEPGSYHIWLLHELLAHRMSEWMSEYGRVKTQAGAERVAWFGHCGEKASLPSSAAHWRAIYSCFGLDLKIVKSGCCGMAGIFGHEACHVKESKAAFAMSWQSQIDDLTSQGFKIVASGYSCRSQVKRLTNLGVQHPLAFLRGQIDSRSQSVPTNSAAKS